MKQTFESDADKKESGAKPPEQTPELPQETVSMMWANPNKPIPAPKRPDHSAKLTPLYSRISELREELGIIESALRHKDPITRTGIPNNEAPLKRVPKTELSYQESVDLYETREELLKELGPLEAERDRLEDEQYTPEETQEMRQARALIEADSQDDPAFGGYKHIDKPDALKHYSYRFLEKFNYYSGQWHAMQGVKWFTQKTGLNKVFKGLGKWLDDFDKRMQAKLAEGRAQKALPPGSSEKKTDDKR
jgi:hypothetical protein